MKHIYFVRHGEIDSNAREIIPRNDEPLNKLGLQQAEICAERIKSLNCTKLMSSDFTRAQQTAQPMAKFAGLPIETVSLFGEFVEPSSLFGVSYADQRVQAYRSGRNNNIENPSWRSEDAENFSDVFSRVLAAKKKLEQETSQSILVVSHSFFIQLFTASILINATAPTDTWFKLATTLKMSNTGITLFTIDEGVWKLIMWNDHAHFAE